MCLQFDMNVFSWTPLDILTTGLLTNEHIVVIYQIKNVYIISVDHVFVPIIRKL